MRAMRHKFFYAVTALIFCFCTLGLSIFYLTQIKPNESIAGFQQEMASLNTNCIKAQESFDHELQYIKEIQDFYYNRSKNFDCGKIDQGRPMDWAFYNNSGCCFDIARLNEVTLKHFGFEVRHTALHQLKYPFPLNYILPVRSHAVTEVKTSKGWLLVGSTSHFIAIDNEQKLYTAKTLRYEIQNNRMDKFYGFRPINYFDGQYSVAYGLYSRHGLLYEPFIPYFPDIDWKQFAYNFE